MTITQSDKIYMESVTRFADPKTGMLSPGDARNLLHQHGLTWEEYIVGEGGGLADWPSGSRDPKHLLSFLGYPTRR